MASRIKSVFLRQTNSIRRSTVDNFKDTIRSHRPNIGNDSIYGSNEYIHKNFFDEDNYQSIIECLDGGYEISTDLIDYMQDYCKLLQQDIDHRISYTKKWKSKLKQQSSLSSYNTTKRAQLQIVRSPEKTAQLLQTRYDAIQQVIKEYRRQVDQMYPGERLNTVHKHYRTDAMKQSFKTARSVVIKSSTRLEKLYDKEKDAKAELHNADIQCQNLSLDETTSKTKLARANDHQEKKQNELREIQEKILRAEKEFNQEQEGYRQKATEIYQQCRELEQERLDQIRKTLIKFTKAIHSSEYSSEQNTLYENLLSNIKNQQDSNEDLDFWAATYNVDILTKSISSETIEDDTANDDTNSTTTTKSDQKQQNNLTTTTTTTEVAEEQPNLDTTTTSTKTKSKKNKNTKSTEKKNSTTTDSTTSDTTELS